MARYATTIQSCFVLHLSDTLVEYMLAHMGVHSAEDVVQQHDVGVRVHRPRQANPLLLAPRQVDPLLAYLRLVPRIQDLEILNVSITRKIDISISFCISMNRCFDASINSLLLYFHRYVKSIIRC